MHDGAAAAAAAELGAIELSAPELVEISDATERILAEWAVDWSAEIAAGANVRPGCSWLMTATDADDAVTIRVRLDGTGGGLDGTIYTFGGVTGDVGEQAFVETLAVIANPMSSPGFIKLCAVGLAGQSPTIRGVRLRFAGTSDAIGS